jgi:hypothetical protein
MNNKNNHVIHRLGKWFFIIEDMRNPGLKTSTVQESFNEE